MKIFVNSGEHQCCIPIPTAFLLNRPMIKLWLWGMRRSQQYVDLPEAAEKALWNLPEESVTRLCDELHRLKKQRREWTFVEVESAAGEQVIIRL